MVELAWRTEAWSRSGKDFPRRLSDALPPRPKAPSRPQTEDEMFDNLDRLLARAERSNARAEALQAGRLARAAARTKTEATRRPARRGPKPPR
jgi:hypothetical protein